MASSRSVGAPQIPGPVIRIAPNPSRLISVSPPILKVRCAIFMFTLTAYVRPADVAGHYPPGQGKCVRPYAAVTAPFCAHTRCLPMLAVRISAATSHAAAVQPRLITEVKLKVSEPSAAPKEKPRYMNEAFIERAMGVPRRPARLISPACCAG